MVKEGNKSYLEKVRFIATSGVLASIYFTLTIILSPISFRNIQIRLAECLTMLCLIDLRFIYGVTLGCFLSNVIGAGLGTNILGMADGIVGSIATLLSCLLVYYLRNKEVRNVPILSIIIPSVINGFLIGYELSLVYTKQLFWLFVLEVGIGELLSCLLGYLLIKYLRKNKVIE